MSLPPRDHPTREHTGDYPRAFGPFALAASEPAGGEGPAWLAMGSLGRARLPCRVQALPMSFPAPPAALARIQSATNQARKLSHANLADTLGLALIDSRLVLVEAHLPGVSLASLLPGAFPPAVAAFLVSEIAGAVNFLRQRGLRPLSIGRLSPERVRIGWRGKLIVLGAGQAVAAEHGLLAARLAHWDGGLARQSNGPAGGDGPSDDVRALGALLWELVAGQAYGAFTAPNSRSNRALALPAGLPAGLDGVLTHSLIGDPGQRFGSAGELAAALRPFVPGRRAGRRTLAALLAARLDVRQAQDQQVRQLRAATQLLIAGSAGTATAAEPGARPRFRVRHWPLLWTAVTGASALAVAHLLAPQALQRLSASPPAKRFAPPASAVVASARPAIVVTPLSPRPPGVSATNLETAPPPNALPVQARLATPRPPRRRPAALPGARDRAAASEIERDRLARIDALLDAAEVRFQWKDFEGAERVVNEALTVTTSPRAYYLHGLILLAMDKAGDAAGAFQRALAAEPGYTDALAKLRIAEERARSAHNR